MNQQEQPAKGRSDKGSLALKYADRGEPAHGREWTPSIEQETVQQCWGEGEERDSLFKAQYTCGRWYIVLAQFWVAIYTEKLAYLTPPLSKADSYASEGTARNVPHE